MTEAETGDLKLRRRGSTLTAPSMITHRTKRIVFTGGSGKAGRHVIPELVKRGHQVLNVDLDPLPTPDGKGLNHDVFTLRADLTDSGQTFNALTTHFNFHGFLDGKVPQPPDAVIHFAANARVLSVPDNDFYKANVVSTYNVIEAACKLGVKKIIIASSETAYGICFAEGDIEFDHFPLQEDDDVNPMDTYGISKLCNERVARGFARRFGVDIYALRIGNVIEPHEYEHDFPRLINKPESRRRHAWSYIDARDLGQICDLCIQKDELGFQVFNATNDTITTTETTLNFLERMAPRTKIIRAMGEYEAPISNKKIKDLLGFREEHNWRRYYNPEAQEEPRRSMSSSR
ncbi:UDP-glucose 4-epimerase [Camillea tinctor]|nr:UDP-glucose 4-epimerase [Camillea tinctor]